MDLDELALYLNGKVKEITGEDYEIDIRWDAANTFAFSLIEEFRLEINKKLTIGFRRK